MGKLGVFRTQTQQMPMTQPSFTAKPIKRKMSTALGPITDGGTPINVSGYSTFPGVANQGRTPSVGAGGQTHNASGVSNAIRRFASGSRVKLITPSGGR